MYVYACMSTLFLTHIFPFFPLYTLGYDSITSIDQVGGFLQTFIKYLDSQKEALGRAQVHCLTRSHSITLTLTTHRLLSPAHKHR